MSARLTSADGDPLEIDLILPIFDVLAGDVEASGRFGCGVQFRLNDPRPPDGVLNPR